MIRRLFWLLLGAGVAALAMRKWRQTRARLTPSAVTESLSTSAGRIMDGVRDFVADVRESSAARAAELTESTGLDGRLGAKPEDFGKQ